MKTITIELYEFSELSQEIKDKMIEEERWNVMDRNMNCFSYDYNKSLEEFEKLTDTTIKYFNVDYCTYNFKFEFDNDIVYEHPIDSEKDICTKDVTGKLLLRYVQNNILPYIIKRKQYYNGKRSRRSNIKYEISDCPLTGCCYDYYLLLPLFNYCESYSKFSKHYSLYDLIRECYESFFSEWHNEYRYWGDDEEAIESELENYYSDNLFHKNGKMYNG